ncbi:MAG: hypothetical protein JNN12_17290 [Bacteroidetes Order II. Incertae sedis bacterium]|nr:hypothetical protein [Bacteroidetes Order II. bacterium]
MKNRNSLQPYRTAYPVRPFNLTPAHRISIKSICDFMQDTADLHAREIGFAYDQLPEGRAWLMIRLRIEMNHYPRNRERMEVETWASGTDRFFAFREFLLFDEMGDQIGCATSSWVMLDLVRKRPGRILPEIEALPWPDLPKPISELPKHILPQNVDFIQRFLVRYGDLDIMEHTNNAVYVGWLAESVPEAYLARYVPKVIDISFKQESVAGDWVRVETEHLSEGGFRHRLVRERDGVEMALALSEWRLREVSQG